MKKRIYSLLVLITMSFLQTRAGSFGNSSPFYSMPVGITATDYMSNTIVIRVKSDYRSVCQNHSVEIPALIQVLAPLGHVTIDKMFPLVSPPAQERNSYGMKMVDISLIYEIHYSAQSNLVKIINQLLRTNVLVFAEPKFIPKVCFTPNDPMTASQQFLTKVNVYNAWNISTGDTTVVIGIVDTGTDTDHPDLAANIKHNYSDPVNGIDDDGDGYIDNFTGWDLGDSDNDPLVGTCGTCAHGSHVSGCADACTNNNVGVAGIGYNCKFLPVKIADSTGALTKAYEGIQYAADHGCQIINCSWGGGGGSALGQTIIDYATINKNATVVVAAGNNNSNALFYPAAFNNVLAVAATNINDSKASFSNYGTFVGICAPGNNIYSTIYDNSYAYESGTSMASPITAGCAAIVKSFYPSYNALQVAEQLRVTADDIYFLSSNAGYAGQLGTGRVNLYKALTQTGISVKMVNPIFTDNNDNVFIVGDTIRFSGDIYNYLAATTNLTATLSSASTNITILNSVVTPGAMATMALYNNASSPFSFIINPGTPLNTAIPLLVTFNDGTYTYVQTFYVTVNVDYINITINDVYTTNTSKGRICYNEVAQGSGLGFNYMTNGTLAYETGLMIGNNSLVSDNFRNGSGANDDDFAPVNTIQKSNPGIWSDFDTYGKFNDAIAPTPLNVTVNHRSASWISTPFSKFHIFEYSIHNSGTSALSTLYAGICSDWDVQTYSNNKADQDPTLKMGYVYCTDAGGYYAGIKVLSAGSFNHYAIDNIAGGNGGMDISAGFTDAQKYTALSTQRPTAGGTGTGNDCIDVVSTGPFSLNPNDSVVVAFALLAGDNLTDLQNSAVQAQVKYDLMTAIKENSGADLLSANPYPNPANDKITIPVYLRKSGLLTVELYDAQGKLVQVRDLGTVSMGDHRIDVSLVGLQTGLYHYRLISPLGQTSGVLQKN